MWLKRISWAPGVVKDDTEMAVATQFKRRRWTDSDKIRFVRGLPQKIGGWTPHSPNTFDGKCRGMLAWQDDAGNARVATGTHKKLYALQAATFLNITPVRASATPTDPFTTANGSRTVTVTHSSHGAGAGDFIQVSSATAVGGLTVDGNYVIDAVNTTSEYTITHASAATSSATGGGTPTIQYEIAIGRADGVQGDGFGIAGFGDGTWGTARSVYIVLPPRTWSLDQWGEYLVGCPRGGDIYEWQLGGASRAAVITNAPTSNIGMFVTEDKTMVALGASGNNMDVKWCDRGTNTTWTASDQNTAGSRSLTGGAKLLFGIRTKGTNLLFTDSAIWTMTAIGGQDVFGFDQIAGGAAGVIGPHAAAEVDGVVFWMGGNDFYMYDGVVRRMPNSKDIRRFVFDNVTALQQDKVYCGVNSLFSEIWWLYTTATEIDRYVKYNWDDQAWDVGAITRTAFVDRGIFANPLAADNDGIIYAHESGKNSVTGTASTTASMAESITSAPFELGDPTEMVDVMAIIPDFKDLAGSLTITLLTRIYPQDTQTSVIMGTVGSSTTKIDARAYGRQVAVKIDGLSTGGFWRLGTVQFEVEKGSER